MIVLLTLQPGQSSSGVGDALIFMPISEGCVLLDKLFSCSADPKVSQWMTTASQLTAKC